MINKKNFKSLNHSGFTLLEILIVIIILGILAALAIPVYSAVREKAVKQEAYQQLAAARESEMRYHSANGAYTATVGNLDFDPSVVNAGVTAHYNYAIAAADTTSFTITATRITTVLPNSTAYTLTIDQAGTIQGG